MELAAFADHGLGVVGPDAGGVDDLLGADLVLAAVLDVGDHGADHAFTLADEPGDARPVGDLGAVRGGGADQVEDEAGVVHLGVVVLEGADQGVLAQAGGDPQGVPAAEVAVGGQAPPVAAGHRHAVVEGDAGSGVEALPAGVLERVEEGHRLDQVRGEPLQEQAAFLQGLPDQGEVEHLQVAQATVDELAGATGGAGRPVAGLDEAGGQSPGDGVQRRSRADHPAAHHEDVQFPFGHRGERLGPLVRSQCACPHP